MAQVTVKSDWPASGINLGSGGGTVINGGPSTVYYRDELPVTTTVNDGSLALGASVALTGVQYFTTASRASIQYTTSEASTASAESANLSDATPLPNGVDAAGTSPAASRADHVHAFQAGGMMLPVGGYVQIKPPNNNGAALTLNREYCCGYLLGPQTLDRLALYMTGTVGSAGAVIRLGVRVDADGSPGAPVAGLEQTVTVTTSGWKPITISYAHPGGILWVSWTGQGWVTTAPQPDTANPGGSPDPRTAVIVPAASRSALDFDAGNTCIVGYQDSVSGALPSTFVNAATSTQRILSLAARRA